MNWVDPWGLSPVDGQKNEDTADYYITLHALPPMPGTRTPAAIKDKLLTVGHAFLQLGNAAGTDLHFFGKWMAGSGKQALKGGTVKGVIKTTDEPYTNQDGIQSLKVSISKKKYDEILTSIQDEIKSNNIYYNIKQDTCVTWAIQKGLEHGITEFSEVNTFPTQWDMSDEEIAGWEYHIIGKKILEKLRGTIAPNNGDLAANIAEYNKKHNGAKEIP